MKIYLAFFSVLFLIFWNSESHCQDSLPVKINLGPNVNSRWDERAPVISPDGKILYFTRGGHPGNTGAFLPQQEQDIWFSVLQPDGSWSVAENIGAPLNTIYPNSVCAVTPDGNTMVALGEYRKDGTVAPGYSISHRTQDGWSFPEKINIKDYYNESRFSNLHMNNDGNVLIIAMERANSYGLKDLFASFRESDTSWSAPVNLGPAINTTDEEYSPFLASDGSSLYFSSKGRGGYGGYDVFVSRRLDSSWRKWSAPENLGPNINSPKDDLFYKIPSSGDYVYFLSYDNSYGEGDIFKILLPGIARPKPVALVSGRVFFGNNEDPVDAKIYYELLPDFKEVGAARTNPKTGEYKITLPLGAEYRFYASADDFISSGGAVNLKEVDEYEEIERNIELSPIETGQVMALKDIVFNEGSFVINKSEYSKLDEVVLFLNGNPGAQIEAVGYYGEDEEDEAGNNLSLQRARNVADYIISKYISKRRVSYSGLDFNKSEESGKVGFNIIR